MTLDEAIKHSEEKAKELRTLPFKEKKWILKVLPLVKNVQKNTNS